MRVRWRKSSWERVLQHGETAPVGCGEQASGPEKESRQACAGTARAPPVQGPKDRTQETVLSLGGR